MRLLWGWAPHWTSRGSRGWTCWTSSWCWPSTTRPGGTAGSSTRWKSNRILHHCCWAIYGVFTTCCFWLRLHTALAAALTLCWHVIVCIIYYPVLDCAFTPVCVCLHRPVCYSGPGCFPLWDTEDRTDSRHSLIPRSRHRRPLSRLLWTIHLWQRSRWEVTSVMVL